MSTNIQIKAVGSVIFPNGQTKEYIDTFNVYQTPTTITEHIMLADDKITAYKNWIISQYNNSKQEIYDLNDWDSMTQYYRVIGYETMNYGSIHVTDLNSFISKNTELGLKIIVESW